jgi:hypothetical protein
LLIIALHAKLVIIVKIHNNVWNVKINLRVVIGKILDTYAKGNFDEIFKKNNI